MFGTKIKNMRRQRGITQTEMSEITGFPQSSISGFEKAEFPDLEYINKACRHFGISLWEFFLDKPEEIWGISEPYLELARQIEKMPPDKKNKFLSLMLNALDLINK